MVVNISLDSNFDVNTIINVSYRIDNGDRKHFLVNDFDLDQNPKYVDAFLNDNKRDTALYLTLLNKNDIWHKRKVFLQLYWLLDLLIQKNNVSEIHLKDGLCKSRVNNVFYSDGERNFNLFVSPIYNINRVINAFVIDNPEVKIIGDKKYFLSLKQFFREISFFALSFIMFLKIFFLKVRLIKGSSSNVIAISRGYAHISYFNKFIESDQIILESYSITSLFKNVFSFSFWKALIYLLITSIKNIEMGRLEIEPHAKYSKLELLAKYIQSLPMTLMYLVNNKENLVKHVVSAELLTAHSAILYFFTKETNSKLSIIQTVSLFKTNNFYFNYCHYFLFESYSMYKWFSEKHDNPTNYLFEGNIYIKKDNQTISKNKILYISQPSLKSIDLDYKIVEKIILMRENVDIRLHPRDSVKRYEGLNVNQSRLLLIDEYDIIVTRTSSMAVQAIYLGLPIIFCLFDDWSMKNKHYYIPKKYFGNANNLNDIEIILNDYDRLCRTFTRFRNNFFLNNSEKDIKTLKQFFYV